MRILHLTAGTGSFFCGSCIRDNALVRGLRLAGHDASLVPLYLPIVSEGASCAAGPIHMGGVNVFLQHASPLFRALPRWVDAPLSTRPVLALAGRFAGRTRPEDVGALTVDMLRGADGGVRKEVDRLVDGLRGAPRPDVIVLSNSLLVGLAAPLRARLEAPVICTVQGEAHFVRDLGPPWTEAAWALLGAGLGACDARIAVSAFAAADLAREVGLDPASFDVVHNGIDLSPFSTGAPAAPPVIGFLARLYDRKGLGTLAEAFRRLRSAGRDVRLRLGGTLNAGDAADVEAVLAGLRADGLGPHVELRPDLSTEDKAAFLRDLTVFCVPSAKDETFGLYNLEALASGVPVVAPRRGALPEVLGDTGGVAWCAPDDPADTAVALAALLDDPARRASLAASGQAAVAARYSEAAMAARAATVFARVAKRAG